MRNPWMQWVVLLPRDISGPEYVGIRQVAPVALRALGLRTGLTHMEWFRRPDGSVAVSEVGARPPGAQISSMLCYTHDFDLYRAWAQLMVHGTFEPPVRQWSAGTVYLRGQGTGQVTGTRGLDQLSPEVTALVSTRGCPPRASPPRAATRATVTLPSGTPTPAWSPRRSSRSSPPFASNSVLYAKVRVMQKNMLWLLASHLHRSLAQAPKACTRDSVLHNAPGPW